MEQERDLILTCDAGTTGLKCSLFNAQGEAVRTVRRAYGTEYPHHNWAQQDCDVILENVYSGIRELLEQVSARRVACVGLSGHMNGCLPVDADGRALAPNIIHADSRSEKQVEKIASRHRPGGLLPPHRQPAGRALFAAKDALGQGEPAGRLPQNALVAQHQGLHLRPPHRPLRADGLFRRLADHRHGHRPRPVGGGTAPKPRPCAGADAAHPARSRRARPHHARRLPQDRPHRRHARGHRRRRRRLHGPRRGAVRGGLELHLHRLLGLGLADDQPPRARPEDAHLQLPRYGRQALPRAGHGAVRRGGVRLGARQPLRRRGGQGRAGHLPHRKHGPPVASPGPRACCFCPR